MGRGGNRREGRGRMGRAYDGTDGVFIKWVPSD
jgi:hypothetical protein